MFKQWCQENRLNNASNLSHVLMNGGKLSIPEDRLKEFYKVYCDAVKSGEKLYVVEQKSELYNFFVDLDYKSKESLDLPEVESIVKVICNKVKAHGGKDALVCLAPPKKAGKDMVKTGIHINFHGFVVDQRAAIALRQHILIALYTAKPSVEWSDVVDASVYGDASRGSRGSGFRMPWSLKRARCEDCGGKGCSVCENHGRVDQVAYLPVYMYRHGPLLSMLQRIDQTPDPTTLEMSSVRSSATTHANVHPPNTAFKEGSFTKHETNDEFADEDAIADLEAFVRKYMEGQASSRLTKAYKQKNGNLIVATTSRYCENTGRDHGGNHVWFLVTGDAVMQKCFCRCETLVGRQFGFCKDFTGKEYKLTSDVKKSLFSSTDDAPTKKSAPKKRPPAPSNFSDVKSEMETFIRKYFSGHEDTKVVEVCKKGGRVLIATNSKFCANKATDHDKFVSFTVDKSGMIQQLCGCRNMQKMKLFASTVDKLKKK